MRWDLNHLYDVETIRRFLAIQVMEVVNSVLMVVIAVMPAAGLAISLGKLLGLVYAAGEDFDLHLAHQSCLDLA